MKTTEQFMLDWFKKYEKPQGYKFRDDNDGSPLLDGFFSIRLLAKDIDRYFARKANEETK